MATAELSLSPRPELVRIARMMAVALARRGGMPEEMLHEVRLAVGEAVTRAVSVHARTGVEHPVRLTFLEDDRGYEVRVHDAGAAADVAEVLDPHDVGSRGERGDLPPELELALIRGMADELRVGEDPVGGTLVRFRWQR